MAAFIIFFLLMFLVLLPFETMRIKTIEHGSSLSLVKRLFVAAATTGAALVIFSIVCGAVMFGPSYITGDFLGLPWFTSLPALLISGWAASKMSKVIANALVASFANGVAHG